MFKTSVKGGYELEDVVAEYGAQQADHVVAAALTMIDAPHQLGGRVMLARALYQILFGAVAEAAGELRGHALYDGHLAPEGAVGQHERADDGGESGVVLIGPAEWVGGAERCRQAVDAAIVGYGDGVELEPGLIFLFHFGGGGLCGGCFCRRFFGCFIGRTMVRPYREVAFLSKAISIEARRSGVPLTESV